MRFFLFILLMLKIGIGVDVVYAEEQAKEQKFLVGIFTQQHTLLCKNQWVDPHYEVGFTRLILPEKSKIKFDTYLDQLVIITGEVDALYQPPPVEPTGDCQGGQARSGRVTGIPALKLKEIKKFEGLHVELTPEEIEVTFENSFLEDLKNVKIIAHYEGCYGKPMTAESTRTFKRLRKKESVFARFPKFLTEKEQPEKRQNHAIQSIQIDSSNNNILFDFDWPIKGGEEILQECRKNNYNEGGNL